MVSRLSKEAVIEIRIRAKDADLLKRIVSKLKYSLDSFERGLLSRKDVVISVVTEDEDDVDDN